jgi:hypothetical protein
MNKFISGASAAVLLSCTAISGLAPAAAAPMRDFHQQDQYIGNYCGQHPGAGQCNDWQMHRGHWTQSQYQGFYRSHRHDNGFGGDAVAGLFGFAAGAAVAGAMNSGNAGDHAQACEHTYRSYDSGSDTYLGNDGSRHACRL